MSSSTSGQWMPIPGPISSHCSRCFGVAFRGRGNQSSGTIRERPSWRWTTRASGGNSIARARALGGLTTEMFMPPLQKSSPVLGGELSDPPQFCRIQVRCVGEPDRFQSDLRQAATAPHVDVRRFLALVAEKEEPVTLGHEEGRHDPVRSLTRRRKDGTLLCATSNEASRTRNGE